jgi:hypothetical protein
MIIKNKITEANKDNLSSLVDSLISDSTDNLNCVKIGIIEEYYPETRTAKVNLVNMLYDGITKEGIQKTKPYPPIYPRIMFIGTVDNGMDYKLQAGDEVLVFFCDRELESWWVSGNISQLNYFRTHHMSDCVAIAGLRSQPLTTITNDNLNIYSKNGIINFEGNVVINGDVTINGNIEITGDATIGGISFLQHVHGNGNNGADTTAPKG